MITDNCCFCFLFVSRIIQEFWEIYLVHKIWENVSRFLHILIDTANLIAHTGVVHSSEAIVFQIRHSYCLFPAHKAALHSVNTQVPIIFLLDLLLPSSSLNPIPWLWPGSVAPIGITPFFDYWSTRIGSQTGCSHGFIFILSWTLSVFPGRGIIALETDL